MLDPSLLRLSQQQQFRLGGLTTLIAGLSLFCTLLYLGFVLIPSGFDPDMFDDPAALLTWAADNLRLYGGMWGLYLLSLLALMPLPIVLFQHITRHADKARAMPLVATICGVGGIVIGMMSVVVLYSVTPRTAPAFAAAADGDLVLVVHQVVADIGLYARLTSELLLALWFLLTARYLLETSQFTRVAWFLAVVGAGTAFVVLTKVPNWLDIEPMWGLVLALTYIVLGLWLMRINLRPLQTEQLQPQAATTDLVSGSN